MVTVYAADAYIGSEDYKVSVLPESYPNTNEVIERLRFPHSENPF